ncbi:MAG: 50S ribosomal protein L22 [Verrucomicrobiae bacterium]|nr:50S ribosomal protein L22 [Verrucomicrobiae bacterium]
MDVISTYKFARVSARKARDVAREIQGLPVSDALDILTFTPRKAAELIGKTMKAAMADAENNFELSVDSLIVKEATIGEGPTFRRYKPRARGSAAPIRKRTSHIRIVLSDATPEAKAKEAPKADAEEAKEEKAAAAPKKKAAAKKKSATKKAAPKKKAAAKKEEASDDAAE